MLGAAYKLKLERRKQKQNPTLNLRKDIKMAAREFSKWEQMFLQQNKNIKNGGDFTQDLESLRNSIYETAKEVAVIKENISKLFTFKDKESDQNLKKTFEQKDLQRIATNIDRRNNKRRILQQTAKRIAK